MWKVFRIRILVLGFYFGIFIACLNRFFRKNCEGLNLGHCERIRGPYPADDMELIGILRGKYLDQPSSKKYNLSKDPIYNLNKHSLSWPFIFHYIKNIFENYTNGFFVEAGALDGEYLSNTLWLEKEFNWTGLLIEAEPENYKELLLKNRKSWTSNTCVSSEPYPKEAIFISRRMPLRMYRTNKWVYRGSTHELGYSNETYLETFLTGSGKTYYSVQCFPLSSYLLALNRTKIDFLSLDIQGAEMKALSSFPFDKIDIRLLAVESIEQPFYDEEFVRFFRSKGFEVIGCSGDVPDYIFIKKKHLKDITFRKIFDCNRS